MQETLSHLSDVQIAKKKNRQSQHQRYFLERICEVASTAAILVYCRRSVHHSQGSSIYTSVRLNGRPSFLCCRFVHWSSTSKFCLRLFAVHYLESTSPGRKATGSYRSHNQLMWVIFCPYRAAGSLSYNTLNGHVLTTAQLAKPDRRQYETRRKTGHIVSE